MQNTLHLFFVGFFATIALAIVFVKAGAGGGVSGGQQTATILTGAGTGLSSVAKTLEGS